MVRDVLKVLEKGKEARSVIKRGEVLVDGKIRKDHAFPVGLFDVVSIPKIGKSWRAVPSKKLIGFVEIPEGEAKTKICKIVDKSTVGNNKVQLNLHDGRNMLTDGKSFKTGDSLLIELPSAKIVDHFKMEKGAFGVVTKGADVGSFGKVKDVIVTKTKDPTKLVYDAKGGERETLKDRFFIVGKDKPAITVGE